MLDWPVAGVIITALLTLGGTLMARFISQRPASDSSTISDSIVKALITNVSGIQTEVALLKQTDQHLAEKMDGLATEWRSYIRDKDRLHGELVAKLSDLAAQVATIATQLRAQEQG